MSSHGYILPTRGVIVSAEDRATQTAKTVADVVGIARRVEALGFDAAWVGDSVLAKPRHEPLIALSAVAGATESLNLGTAVYLPPLRHPVHIAHQTATLDQLSGGRFCWGVGVGIGSAVQEEYDELDIPYRRRGPMLDESLDVVTQLWTGDPVEYDGRFYSLDGASIGFQPTRTPPVYVASSDFDLSEGFPEPIAERIGIHADGWLPGKLSPEKYTTGIETVRGFLEDHGRNPKQLDAAYYLDVLIADSEKKAQEEAREFFTTYYPGLDDPGPFLEKSLLGTPESVVEQIAAYEEAGVETFVTRFLSENQREQLNRYADLVDEL